MNTSALNGVNFKKSFFVFLVIILISILVRLPSFNALLDTDSSANAFFARQMLHGETLYDKYHTAHHLPGIYYTFLLAFKIWGDDPLGIRLLLQAFFMGTAWLIYKMGEKFFDELSGALGAFFFILLASQVTLSGMTAEMEHFANLALTGVIFLYLRLAQSHSPPRRFFWVGALGAICVLYKIIFVGALTAVGAVMLAFIWIERRKSGAIQRHIQKITALIMGFLLPLALTAGYFIAIGLWDRFLLIFKFGFGYFDNTNLFPGGIVFPKPFGFPFFMLAMNNIALLLFGFIGMYRLLCRAFPLRVGTRTADMILPLWFIFSLGLAGARGNGFGHYVLVVVPPLALLAGAEISMTYARWQSGTMAKHAKAGLGVMILLIIAAFTWRNFDVYQKYSKYLLTPRDVRPSIFTYAEDQIQKLAVIEYLKKHSSADDLIYVWSTNLQEFYYADRLPPIDILWPEYVSATGAPERIFAPETTYIVVDRVKSRPDWLSNGLRKSYTLEIVIDERLEIYRRTAP